MIKALRNYQTEFTESKIYNYRRKLNVYPLITTVCIAESEEFLQRQCL